MKHKTTADFVLHANNADPFEWSFLTINNISFPVTGSVCKEISLVMCWLILLSFCIGFYARRTHLYQFYRFDKSNGFLPIDWRWRAVFVVSPQIKHTRAYGVLSFSTICKSIGSWFKLTTQLMCASCVKVPTHGPEYQTLNRTNFNLNTT